jgi:recombinational DNA repair protein (RecF pathway)
MITVICKRIADLPQASVASGRETCARCGAPVSVHNVLTHDRAVCDHCAPHVLPLGAKTISPPEQQAELTRHGLTNREVHRLLGRYRRDIEAAIRRRN